MQMEIKKVAIKLPSELFNFIKNDAYFL